MQSSNIDLYKAIPETKCIDFIKSFFKTFNISVYQNDTTDGRLFFLTPEDLKAENKEYSKKEVDYTPYVWSKKINKEIPTEYNFYNFKHKNTKYKSNIDYKNARGVEFGQLTYPTTPPESDKEEFIIQTDFSIIPTVPLSGLSELRTSYGFTNDTPTIAPNGALRYTPNLGELTMFFGNTLQNLSKPLGFQVVAVSGQMLVSNITSYIPTSPVHESGFSLGFGLIEQSTVQSLYNSFYKEQTERLLDPNVLESTFMLKLPASELVISKSNDIQGQSNIPNGFRLQNDIIIQENKYSILEATIDKTTGNTTLKLLNY
jgi:hypothetical protein